MKELRKFEAVITHVFVCGQKMRMELQSQEFIDNNRASENKYGGAVQMILTQPQNQEIRCGDKITVTLSREYRHDDPPEAIQ